MSVSHKDDLRQGQVAPSPEKARPDLSAVIPCYNEEENVEAIAKAVIAEFVKETENYEIVFIDNCSTDRTVALIKQMCQLNNRIRLIVNNQNYGQLRSPTHAIYQTTGRAVIGICADFQDPPPMIGEFIRRWKAGAEIVLAVRAFEKTSWLTRLIRATGYGLLSRLGDYPLIPGATGFGLYDRRVVDCLAEWVEPQPFFRGMLIESGFRLETVPYTRPGRARGVSKNNFFTLADFSIAALASSSRNWLRIPLYLSLLLFVGAGLTLAAAVLVAAMQASPWPLVLATFAELAFGGLFFFLGLIGEQVRLISERTRNGPLVIERERVNF